MIDQSLITSLQGCLSLHTLNVFIRLQCGLMGRLAKWILNNIRILVVKVAEFRIVR